MQQQPLQVPPQVPPPPPQVPAWVISAAETCAAKFNREDWSQETEDLKKFASKKRRTEETLVKEHKCDPPTLRWLTTAWAKQEPWACPPGVEQNSPTRP